MTAKPTDNSVYFPPRERFQDAASRTITPESAVSAVNDYVAGRPHNLLDMFNQIMRIDLAIRGLLDTRQNAIDGLEWEILPGSAPESQSERAADAAAYVADKLDGIESLDLLFDNVLNAIRHGVTLTEIFWKVEGRNYVPHRFRPVVQTSVVGDPSNPWIVNVTTERSRYIGEPVYSFPNKFVVAYSKRIGNSPFGGGLNLPTTLAGVVKRWGWAWFVSYAEKFGTPLLWFNYPTTATPADKDKAESWLENLAHNGFAGFPTGFDLKTADFSAKGSGVLPQDVLIERINKETAIGVLGQPLTSGTQGDTGSFALGKVQNLVREDIRDADLERESAAITRYLIRPMIELSEFAGAPIPYFKRKVPDQADRNAELDLAIKVGQQTPIRRGSLYEAAGMPIPADDSINGEELIELDSGAPAGIPGLFTDYGPDPRLILADEKKNKSRN